MKKSNYDIEKGQVHIWKLHMAGATESLQDYQDILAPAEKLKSSGFKFAKDRNMFTFSRAVLRLLSGRYLEMKPEAIRFKYGSFGKPFFGGDKPLHFNLSHSGDMALIAFSDTEIGVDIEKVGHKKDILEVAKTVFCSHEMERLNALKGDRDKVRFFYELWTRKEAYIKQLGFGLSMPISLTDISVLKEKIEISKKSEEAQQGFGGRNVISFEPQPDYQAALSWPASPMDLTFFDWEL